ncbi:MAG: nucleotide sugar dehydrogenase [Eubacteriales bacterium]|nr:nucleotide sugar dehydrogenase [Eubacteriales bacterium]
MKKICMIGIGYVGLPTAAMFASKGHKVIGYDLNKRAVDALNKGEIIIEEPGLLELVKECVEKGNLSATTECPDNCDVYIIAVPTPINEDKTADMSYVESATKAIVPHLKKGNIVILESTSPPRTVEDLMLPILKETGLEIGEELLVAHSPERILPGKVIEELRTNSRIVGGINEKSSLEVKKVYESIVEGEIFITTSTTAEMCKVMENTFRDVNIALANELAKISEELGVNAFEVIKLANHHPRVNILSPGPGVGGHCIALDPWFLVEKSENAKLIKQARLINDSMPEFVFNKIKNILGGFNGQTISLFGVTYKPNIDDIRESPVMHLLKMLEKENVIVKVCDPHAKEQIKNNFDIYEATENSSLLILGVNHDEFKNIDFGKVAENLKDKNILDTRNFFDRKEIENNGINYYLLGEKNN